MAEAILAAKKQTLVPRTDWMGKRLFVRHGAKVIAADVQDDLGHSLCADNNSQESVSFVHCDVTNESDVQNIVNTVISNGKLDIMFNYASIPGKCDMRIIETDGEDFKRVFNVNVFGVFLGAKHAARVMIPAKKGTILFTSSIYSVISGCLATHACTASKHAIVGLTKNLCVELGQYGIRVNCISLFAVVTLMMLNNMARDHRNQSSVFINIIRFEKFGWGFFTQLSITNVHPYSLSMWQRRAIWAITPPSDTTS
ncbi:hypothetical protein ACSBR1_017968 [Camellia fascicularis]